VISIETKYNQLVDENAMLTRTIAALKTALHQAQIHNATAERRHILYLSGLPQASVDRLHVAFAKSTDNAGLREAINVEKRGAQ
jgi:hypothetical protein